MPHITIHLHQDLADQILVEERDSERSLLALWRQAGRAMKTHGNHIAYAPAVLPNGAQCAMSVHAGLAGISIEVDRPGTLIPGRGVVPETEFRDRRPGSKKR